MSNGKLKAQYNRVRTSAALQAHSMWTQVIGFDQEAHTGSNAVIEARLKAPKTGKGRQARREAAQALIEGTGYEPVVNSFEGLVALAKAQGNVAGGKRGACRICGGMGHMTKQCKNHLSSFYQKPSGDGADGAGEMPLPVVHESSEISSLSSDSDSCVEESRRRIKRRKRKEKRKEAKSSSTASHKKDRNSKREEKRRTRRKREEERRSDEDVGRKKRQRS